MAAPPKKTTLRLASDGPIHAVAVGQTADGLYVAIELSIPVSALGQYVRRIHPGDALGMARLRAENALSDATERR